MEYIKMFEKGTIGTVELKNRIVMPPMGVGLGDGSGLVDERQIAYFEERAKGGVGLIISSCCAIDEEYAGLAETGQISLVNPAVVDGLKRLVDAVHKHNSKIIFQLLHPGRQGSSQINRGQQPVGPSAVKEADYLEMPRALSTEEVQILVQKFIDGARRVFQAGADGIELHGAHGYLIHQFMSKRANYRTDQYGGNFENRMRFVREIFEGIKVFQPQNTFISIRINGCDFVNGGFTIEDGIEMSQYLEGLGFDTINISTGGYSNLIVGSDPPAFPEACRTHFIKPIMDAVSIPVIAANNVKRPQTAEKLLEEGTCDFVVVGRGLLADPYFVEKAMKGEEDKVRSCINCGCCIDTVMAGHPVVCSFNPMIGVELEYNDNNLLKDGMGRRIVVIGGGPGGMQAAITAAKRGFDVTLFDKGVELGGALLMANKAPGKYKVDWSVEAFKSDIEDLKIDVRLSTTIDDASEIEELDPYAVVVAVGGEPIIPQLPGIDSDNVVTAHELLSNPDKLKQIRNMVVAIIGSGMTGIELAEILTEGNNKITLYDMQEEIAPGANLANKLYAIQMLTEQGVQFKTQHQLKKLTSSGAVFEELVTGMEMAEKSDLIVFSIGIKPNCSLAQCLRGKFERVVEIGDCAGGSKIYEATGDGMRKMWDI